ncbi:unnamed protein product [Rangifer tarandus platyrhynchus]|uniref:Uncharacterized protein n=1 Tax=Rangifer tarandus platyrhynchus TaxID=3082113 RepID=A0ABN8XZ56_RANTA|nr:unnamed protein product [Rangifer tarandus platyrhynchus]
MKVPIGRGSPRCSLPASPGPCQRQLGGSGVQDASAVQWPRTAPAEVGAACWHVGKAQRTSHVTSPLSLYRFSRNRPITRRPETKEWYAQVSPRTLRKGENEKNRQTNTDSSFRK